MFEPRRLGTQLEMQAMPAEHFTSVCLNGTHSRNTIALAHKMETTKTQTNGNEHDLIRALLTLITPRFKLGLHCTAWVLAHVSANCVAWS